MWPPNSPDLNPVDYAVWGALQQMVYRRRSFTTVDQLKETIVTEWTKLSQRFIDAQLINGVVGFNALSSSKEDTLNILCNEIHPCNVTVKIIAGFSEFSRLYLNWSN